MENQKQNNVSSTFAIAPFVLLHDSDEKTMTVQALLEIIENLKGRGYEFKVLTKKTGAG
ncbi:hypothetical protein [Paenibacillus amylolyticus]|uniref:hypothetical protein n=1 Tax=Paenibacillus amylolyticus TaxID=1451 RepID=UPI0013E34DF8|nr:hypothetical protein [Paenibacillus amylolyticus]